MHGDAAAFAFAAATDRFVVQLGDLTDYGPDSAGALRLMFELIDAGRGLFLLGNHDHKLGRALLGRQVRFNPELQATIGQLDDALRERTLREIERAPLWLRAGRRAVRPWRLPHRDAGASRPAGLARPEGALARALYGRAHRARCSPTAIPSAASPGWTASPPG